MIDPSLETASARLEARLAESTREVARLADIAMHPQMRAAIVCAKSELQHIAFDRHRQPVTEIGALDLQWRDRRDDRWSRGRPRQRLEWGAIPPQKSSDSSSRIRTCNSPLLANGRAALP